MSRSEIRLEELRSLEEQEKARWIFDTVWPKKGTDTEITPNLLQAMVHNGAYLLGVFSGEQIIGASFGFSSIQGEKHLHSHLTGLLDEFRDSGTGYEMKRHQWYWAKKKGYASITWTFDPLIRRNARFNINKLGADVVSYHENFYGNFMPDTLNSGDESDRLLVRWDLSTESPTAREKLETSWKPVTIALPEDIVSIRQSDQKKSKEWRLKVREEFKAAFADGKKVIGFSSDNEYLLA